MAIKKEYLIFHLYGPMASFGDVAVGEYRPTHAHPTKSAILGIVSGALGIRRDEEERHKELESSFGFAVMVLHEGQLLRDYHTSQVPSSGKNYFATRKDELAEEKSKLHTILSARDYRTDAMYRVALWKKTTVGPGLSELQNSLEQPVFVPYLGRKSCPVSLPMDPEIVSSENEVTALEASQIRIKDKMGKILSRKENTGYLVYTESANHKNTIQSVWRKDKLTSRNRWQFSDRREFMIKSEGKNVL